MKPRPQMMGQLPIERLTPGPVFDNVGVDYAGPVYIKYGFVRKPTIVKAYICVFVSLSVKAVHLELVSDLTTGAFIASLRRFIAMVSHLPFGGTMAPTSLEQHEKSLTFWKSRRRKIPSPSFVLHRTLCGSSFLSLYTPLRWSVGSGRE